MALFQCVDLHKSYRLPEHSIPVLRGVSLSLESGADVAIVGASGIGKTTLLHCLGLLDEPSVGQLLYEGTDLFRMRPGERAAFRNKRLGFVFQFHYLLGEFTALENVMMPLRVARCPEGEARERAVTMLASVGLRERITHYPAELSGGEQQRVAVARALVTRPEIILADEPTGNLDPVTATQVFELLLSIKNELNAILILVTHNLTLAESVSRQYVLTEGRLMEKART